MSDLLSSYLRKKLRGIRLILTVGTGRNGSAHLAKLLSYVPGIASFHEPAPYFWQPMHEALRDRQVGIDFWREKKLPIIAECANLVYFESSHLACKGLLEALVELDVEFDLIHLRRDPRKVALSLLRLETIPGRTELGRQYLWSPEEVRGYSQLDTSNWDDYQMTYWYAKSMDSVASAWRDRAASIGSRFCSIDLEELVTFGGFRRLLSELQLKQTSLLTWNRFARNRKSKTNSRTYAEPIEIGGRKLDQLESEIHEALESARYELTLDQTRDVEGGERS
ncbi:MAG: hypothetical protein AAFX06_04050 [Planctomycetota bacterium]